MQIRAVAPDEYERVGDLTVAAYAALPVDHLWGGYDDEIRAVAERCETAEVLVAVLDGEVVGAVTYVSDPDSPWLEWSEPGEAQIRLLAVDGVGAGPRHRRGARARVHRPRARARAHDPAAHDEPHAAAQRLYPRMGFVRRPERDVHEFEAEHDMTFLAFTFDPNVAP